MAQQTTHKGSTVGVRFAPNIKEQLDNLAVIMGVTAVDIIRLAVKEYIDRNLEQHPPVDRIASAVVEQLLAKGLVGNVGAQMGTVKEDDDGE